MEKQTTTKYVININELKEAIVAYINDKFPDNKVKIHDLDLKPDMRDIAINSHNGRDCTYIQKFNGLIVTIEQ